MSESKKICLLGFAPEAEKVLRKIITEGSAASFEWVPASNRDLSGVVINAGFLETPQIQKYIAKVNKPVVAAYTGANGKHQADQQGIKALDLTAFSRNDIESWLEALLRRTSPAAIPSRERRTAAAASAGRANADGSAMKQEDILKLIRSGSDVVLRGLYRDQNTWIKVAEGLVFIDYAREKVPGYDLWQWQTVSESSVPHSARQLKLDLWLFEALWHSTLKGGDYIDLNAFYQLNRWPQPLSKQGRTEILRLAANAQGRPVSIKFLQDKTHYSPEQIAKFLFASSYAGQADVVKGHRSINSVPKSVTLSAADQKKNEEKRSLLSRFRQKLGL